MTLLGRRVPLTNDVVENGKCMICHQIEDSRRASYDIAANVADRSSSWTSCLTSSSSDSTDGSKTANSAGSNTCNSASCPRSTSSSSSQGEETPRRAIFASREDSTSQMTLNTSTASILLEASQHSSSELERIQDDDDGNDCACALLQDHRILAQHMNMLVQPTEHNAIDDAWPVKVVPAQDTEENNANEDEALNFLAHLSDVGDIVQCMDGMIDKTIVQKECLCWLSNMTERLDGACELMSVKTLFGTLLDVIEHHLSNLSVLIPALELVNRLLSLSIIDGQLKHRVQYLSVLIKGTSVGAAVHIMEIGGLGLSQKIIHGYVNDVNVMKLACEMMWNFCIAQNDDISTKCITASNFVDEGMVPFLQCILEEQADPGVLANAVNIIYFIVQSSERGKRELLQNNGATALQQVLFICEGLPDLKHSVRKVLQLL